MLTRAMGINLKSSVPLMRAALVRGIKTIPQPPGYVVGDVNQPYQAPPPKKMEGSLHWTLERIVCVGILPLTVAPFLSGVSTLVDSTMSALLLYHCYSGFQSCIIDYIPMRVYGAYHKAAMYLLALGTGVAGYGIYKIEKKEGGLFPVIAKVWKA